ncbi:MAG: hypothetical protein U0003_02260 [Vampirovibrionales bacterium]
MLAALSTLPAWVQGIRDFQRLALVNKAVMDVTAVDIPFITLAKNNTERKERIFRQFLVLLMAFVMAPLHAVVFSRWMSKHVGLASKELNKTLMQLSFKELANDQTFQAGIKTLYAKVLEKPVPAELAQQMVGLSAEALRQKVLKAKSLFLRLDLTTEGFFFSTIGPLKAKFGEWMMGNKQFTGEKGLAEQSTLDKLYAQSAEKKKRLHPVLQWLDRYKTPLSMGFGMVIPFVWATLVQRAYRPTAMVGGVMRWIRTKAAHHFDYHFTHRLSWAKHIPFISDWSMMLIVLSMHASELTVMRSKRELREYIVQRVPLDITFFLGIPAFMRWIAGSTTVDGAIQKAIQRGKPIRQAAQRSGYAYLASFVLACGAVAGSVALGNVLTRRGVKAEAGALHYQEAMLNRLFKPFNRGLVRPVLHQWVWPKEAS